MSSSFSAGLSRDASLLKAAQILTGPHLGLLILLRLMSRPIPVEYSLKCPHFYIYSTAQFQRVFDPITDRVLFAMHGLQMFYALASLHS